ncbi:hypothetical protein HPP92_011176 [Vanilla planifolia]|uniref:DYW domain-containing protein n=1 Tax=Vanilla planifolia TaxID=51239 RepID=A0A835RAY3_VANPL|nr:hypothetical protein HPP92_011176 [Vanilla planifolia]
MISACANEGSFQEALKLLKQMEREGIKPNLATWNGLISGYAMKGKARQALILIRQLRFTGLKGDVVSWTALISGCSQNKLFEDSVTFFAEMQNDGVKPNSATLVTVLKSCASLGLLKKGSELHCYATRRGMDMKVHVSTALIDMYCKSGNLRNAHQVFRMLEDKNVATWNAMIVGFANYGKTKEAFLLFEDMLSSGIKPDSITFTALLTGCRHSGLIDAGWKYFDDMKQKYNITPTLEHYAGIADLLARGGFLDEALDFIKNMPFKPDAGVWGSLLCACKTHRNLQVAEFAAKNLLRLEPRNSANYMLMIAIYAAENQWDDVHNMRVAMNRLAVKSGAGWSWLQIGQTIHSFSVEGQTHPEMGTIYFELYQLVSKMKVLGYVPDTSCIVHNIREEEKKKLLMAHTEKLAITYGLIKTSKGMPLRVVTNIRVCNDCHVVAKLISEISGREIFLRDGVRVHHFKQGQCSCNDYW